VAPVPDAKGVAAAVIRPARDDDGEGIIAVIGGCFAEYPNCVLDVDGELGHLRAVATRFAALGGRFWVAEREGGVVASVGLKPRPPQTIELVSLYVARSARGAGLAARLVALVLDEARERSAAEVVLWTDTRFFAAHRLYERLGFALGSRARALADASDSREYCYRLALK
jgi:putative acetyltransferase